jgi:hypothetical protein
MAHLADHRRGLNNHSVPTGPPFSATERFINNTANVTTNVNTAAIQKVSK